MNRERLEDMALLMDIVQKHMNNDPRPQDDGGMGFSLTSWKRPTGYADGPKCGAVACAIGWACEVNLIPGLEWCGDIPVYRPEGTDRTWRDWHGLSLCFDMPESQLYRLFMATAYPAFAQPCDVAARIRKLLAQA